MELHQQALGRGVATRGRLIHLPVHVRDRRARQRQAQSRLSQQLGRGPTADEVAAALGVRPAPLAQLDAAAQEVCALNAPIRATDDRLEFGDALADRAAGPEERAVAASLRRDLAAALRRCLTSASGACSSRPWASPAGRRSPWRPSAPPRAAAASAPGRSSPAPSPGCAMTR